jgi:hypothetical protein
MSRFFLKTSSTFSLMINDHLSNEPNFGRIHLARQYLITGGKSGVTKVGWWRDGCMDGLERR